MTGLVFLSGGGLILILKKKTSVAHETGEELSEAMSNLYNAVSEHLSGMKIAKSYGTEAHHVDISEDWPSRFGTCIPMRFKLRQR